MARFEVFANEAGPGFLLDVQADLLDHLNTRLVVPLLPLDQGPRPARRLNPVFETEGRSHVMVTQFAAVIPVSRLGRTIISLSAVEYEISNALDMLLKGF